MTLRYSSALQKSLDSKKVEVTVSSQLICSQFDDREVTDVLSSPHRTLIQTFLHGNATSERATAINTRPFLNGRTYHLHREKYDIVLLYVQEVVAIQKKYSNIFASEN